MHGKLHTTSRSAIVYAILLLSLIRAVCSLVTLSWMNYYLLHLVKNALIHCLEYSTELGYFDMPVSKYVVAAMCGNFKAESNVNPGIWEQRIPSTWDHEYQYDDIGGFGLGQWTNVGTQYGRLWDLHTWVTSNGYQDGDGNGQVAYIPVENVWYSGSSLGYSTLSDFLNSNSTDLYALTYDWLICWEGIGTDSLAERYEAAQYFLDYLNAHENDNPADYVWISTNEYLDWWEMYNNVMCVYFAFNGYTPPTPPDPPDPPDPPIPTGPIDFVVTAAINKRRKRIKQVYKPK